MKNLTTFIYESSDKFQEYVKKLQELKEFSDKHNNFWNVLNQKDDDDDSDEGYNADMNDEDLKEEQAAYDKYLKAKAKLEKEYAKEAAMFNQISIHAIKPQIADKYKDKFDDEFEEE